MKNPPSEGIGQHQHNRAYTSIWKKRHVSFSYKLNCTRIVEKRKLQLSCIKSLL